MAENPATLVNAQSTFDAEAIKEHLTIIHSSAKGIDGKLVVSVFNEGASGTITHHRVGDVSSMHDAVMAHATTPGANPFTGLYAARLDLPRHQRGGEHDTIANFGLVVDLDADTGRFGELPIAASYVIETSPGNFQAAILFDKPMNRASAKRLAKALQKATGADFGTGDIVHPWRIAGTLNWPNATKLARGRSPEPFAVRFSQRCEGLVYREATLLQALSPWLTSEDARASDAQFQDRVDSGPLWQRLRDIGRALLTSDGGDDRSVHAARVAEQLHFEGFSLNEAVSLCLERPGKWTARYSTDERLIRDIERCWQKFAVLKDAERAENARAAEAFVHSTPNASPEPRLIRATPFVYQEPLLLAPRETLYADHYHRKFLSVTVGAGGGGKSSLVVIDVLAMISGRPLLGHSVTTPLKVWYFNLEDPADEIQRRFTAAVIHHGIDPEFLNRNLFVDSGRDQSLVILKQEARETKVGEPVVESLIAAMKEREIDVLVVDPFVSAHEIDENDNNKIQQVANQFVRIANEANASVELVHHVNKSSGDGKGEVNAESGRGAGALKDKARSVRALNTMSEDQAKKAGIDPEDRFAYFRVTNAKSNMAKRTGHADWRRVVSVELGNARDGKPSDNVGVVEKWDWPSDTSVADQISPDLLRAAKSQIASGQYGENPQAGDWAGKVFARILDLNLMSAQDRHKINRVMRGLVDAGHFVIVKRSDKNKGRTRPMFEVAQFPHPETGGVGMTVH